MWDHFRVAQPSAVADLDICLAPVEVDTTRWLCVDHRYYANEDELCFNGCWRGTGWRTHWRGLTGPGPVQVTLQLGWSGLLRFPWLLQAEWVLDLFVFRPLTGLLWNRQGRYLVHASALARDGSGVVFTGLGSGLKTSLAMHLARQGWALLGDDQVLVGAEGLLGLPLSLHTFDFRLNHLPDEYLTSIRLLRLGWHLLCRGPVRVNTAAQAEIGTWNVVVRTNRDTPRSVPISTEEAVNQTVENCIAERIAVSQGACPPSEPLTAFSVVCSDFDHDPDLDGLRILLQTALKNVPTYRLELGPVWDPSFGGLAQVP